MPTDVPSVSRPADRPKREGLLRVAKTTAIVSAIIASLCCFPGGVPWMIAGWLLAYTVQVFRQRAAWPAILAALAVVLVKRVDWPNGGIVLGVAMIAAALVDLVRRHQPEAKVGTRQARLAVALVWIAWIVLWFDARAGVHASRPKAFQIGRPIVCFGDSLTSGVPPAGSYARHLAQRLSPPVVNLGREGITTAEGLKLMPLVLAERPQIVVLELGGHDFLQGFPRSETKARLETMIAAVRAIGGEVVLIEVPRGFIYDPYAGLERQLAREQDLELVPDSAIRNLVLWSAYAPPGMWTSGPYLSDDGLHPNAHGNEHLAQCVAAALERMYGNQILAR